MRCLTALMVAFCVSPDTPVEAEHYTLTVEYNRVRKPPLVVRRNRERTASITISVRPGEPFKAKASLARDTFAIAGIIDQRDNGSVSVSVRPTSSWSNGRSSRFADIHQVDFDQRATSPRRDDDRNREAVTAELFPRIDECDGKFFGHIADTYAIGLKEMVAGLTKDKREWKQDFYVYYLVRVKEASAATDCGNK